MYQDRTAGDGAGLEGGFVDPVFDAQAAFARVMNAFARPGRIIDLGGRTRPPSPVPPAAGAFLATLADADTPVWLDAAARNEAIAAWLSFHTGAVVVDKMCEARFALVCDPATMPPLDEFALGTDAYPDRSTTLILSLECLRSGPALRLHGPGIETEAEAAPKGLPAAFLGQWAANGRLYPRGIDILMVAADEACALPRTTKIEER